MSDLNRACILGRLGADPETRATSNGTTVVNLRVATSEKWTDKQTGDKKESTEWHTIVLFGRLGDIAAQYLSKGRQVYIEGRLQTRKWQGQDRQDRYTTEIVASNLILIGSGGQQAPQNKPQNKSQSEPAADDFSDDVPFN